MIDLTRTTGQGKHRRGDRLKVVPLLAIIIALSHPLFFTVRVPVLSQWRFHRALFGRATVLPYSDSSCHDSRRKATVTLRQPGVALSPKP
jgi:hypothetical protein